MTWAQHLRRLAPQRLKRPFQTRLAGIEQMETTDDSTNPSGPSGILDRVQCIEQPRMGVPKANDETLGRIDPKPLIVHDGVRSLSIGVEEKRPSDALETAEPEEASRWSHDEQEEATNQETPETGTYHYS